MPFLLLQGDISQIKTDAVVNSADTGLLGGGAVSECLHKAAGSRLKLACAALSGCAAGEVKVTEGYNLPCKYIIHAVAPVWQGGQNGEEALLASCYRRALKEAAELGCSSVAFPLLAAGINGYPKEQALRVASETIAEFLQERELDVFLVFLDRESFPKDYIPNSNELNSFIVKSYSDCLDFFTSLANEYHSNSCYYKGMPTMLDGPLAWIDQKAGIYYYGHEEEWDVREYRTLEPPNSWYISAFNDLPVLLSHAAPISDENFNARKAWAQMLIQLMRSKGINCEQCAGRANINSSYLQSLCCDADVSPDKSTALALAIALELSVAETSEMLAKLGFIWQRCDLFEAITEFFIAKGIYDVHRVNLALFAYKQRLLGNCALYADEWRKHEKYCDLILSPGDDVKLFEAYLAECKRENADSSIVKFSEDGKTFAYAGNGCSSVDIPGGITKIASSAFASCCNLISIIIPETVNCIEDYAFKNCSSLTDIQLPHQLQVINCNTFIGCAQLQHITIPSGVTLIDEGAFKDCLSLSDVSIPASVETIESCAFQNCTSLTTVRLPGRLTSVSAYLFGNCRRLTKVELPDDLAAICTGAFFNCDSLSFIKLPLKLKSIGNDAFWNCRRLEMSDIPSGVEEIGSGAFYNCQSLRRVILPSGLNKIHARAFMNCIGITFVKLPAGVSYIANRAFSDCSSLVSVDLAEGETAKAAAEQNVISKESLDRFCELINEREQPPPDLISQYLDGRIGNYAFWNCRKLTSVHLPSGFTGIDSCAFAYCESLREIYIPDTVAEIGKSAFLGCKRLNPLVVPDSVSKIAGDAFEGVPCVVYDGTAEGAPWGAGKVVPRRAEL